jgi:hypothetical protein
MSFTHSSILDPAAKSVREVAQDKSIRVQRTWDGNGDQGFSRVSALDGLSRGIDQIVDTMGDYARVGFGTICTHICCFPSRTFNRHCDFVDFRNGSL